MANTKSAQKAVRTAANNKKYNDLVRDKVRQARLAITKAISGNEKSKKLDELLSNFYKQVDKASKRGGRVLSKNKAARLKSSMAQKATLAGK
jgi:ribosomal protein S20